MEKLLGRGSVLQQTVSFGAKKKLLQLTILFTAIAAMLGCSPLINDVTTDFENPPLIEAEDGAGAAVPYPEEFQSKQEQAYPQIKPLRIDGCSFEQAFEELLQLARQQKRWRVVKHEKGRVQVKARTMIFRFIDDLTLELRDEKGRLVLHARSRSRVGRGDLGANARRIERFLSVAEEHLCGE